MSAPNSLKKYAEQNPVLILAGVIIIVALVGIFLWHENQKQTYYASRGAECAQLGEAQKAELEARSYSNGLGIMEESGVYTYDSSADDCVFEEDLTAIPPSGVGAVFLTLSSLFSKNDIIGVSSVIYQINATTSNPNLEAQCAAFNSTLGKYFNAGEGLPCEAR